MADNVDQPSDLTAAALTVLATLVLVLVAGFVVLTLAGRDTSTYTLFVAGPLVTSVVGAILSRRVHKVERIAQTVQAQTDGALTAQVEGLHEHLDAQTAQILDPATAQPGLFGPIVPSPGRPQGAIPAPRPQSTSEVPAPWETRRG